MKKSRIFCLVMHSMTLTYGTLFLCNDIYAISAPVPSDPNSVYVREMMCLQTTPTFLWPLRYFPNMY